MNLASLLEMQNQQPESQFDIQDPDIHAARVEQRIEQLTDRFASFSEIHVFEPGDIVEWKPGLKISRYPEYGEPAIVIQVGTDGLTDIEPHGTGSAYANERYDIILAVIDGEGDFSQHRFDSRRLRKVRA